MNRAKINNLRSLLKYFLNLPFNGQFIIITSAISTMLPMSTDAKKVYFKDDTHNNKYELMFNDNWNQNLSAVVPVIVSNCSATLFNKTSDISYTLIKPFYEKIGRVIITLFEFSRANEDERLPDFEDCVINSIRAMFSSNQEKSFNDLWFPFIALMLGAYIWCSYARNQSQQNMPAQIEIIDSGEDEEQLVQNGDYNTFSIRR